MLLLLIFYPNIRGNRSFVFVEDFEKNKNLSEVFYWGFERTSE